MTTASSILTAVAALLGVLLSLGSLSPRARRMRRLEQRVALLKDVPEGRLRQGLEELAVDALIRVQAREPRFDLADALVSLGLRYAGLGFFAVIGANVGWGLAGGQVDPLYEPERLIELVVGGARIIGWILIASGLLVALGALTWSAAKTVKRRREEGAAVDLD